MGLCGYGWMMCLAETLGDSGVIHSAEEAVLHIRQPLSFLHEHVIRGGHPTCGHAR